MFAEQLACTAFVGRSRSFQAAPIHHCPRDTIDPFFTVVIKVRIPVDVPAIDVTPAGTTIYLAQSGENDRPIGDTCFR